MLGLRAAAPCPHQHPLPASSGGHKGSPFCGCCLVSEDAAGVSDPLIHLSSVLSTGSMQGHNGAAALGAGVGGSAPRHPFPPPHGPHRPQGLLRWWE